SNHGSTSSAFGDLFTACFQPLVVERYFFPLAMLGWFTKYSWRCEPIDFSNNRDAVRIAEVCWICFLIKFYEFI
ncbi:unnamed protein product, partial [Larinioides sclopetarius]